jgi:hypothetical protein
MAGPRGAELTAPARKNGGWTPKVSTLVILIALEITFYCVLRWAFRTAHGG